MPRRHSRCTPQTPKNRFFSVNVGLPRCSNTSVIYPIKHRRSLNTPKEQIVQHRANANLLREGQRYTATGHFQPYIRIPVSQTALFNHRLQQKNIALLGLRLECIDCVNATSTQSMYSTKQVFSVNVGVLRCSNIIARESFDSLNTEGH